MVVQEETGALDTAVSLPSSTLDSLELSQVRALEVTDKLLPINTTVSPRTSKSDSNLDDLVIEEGFLAPTKAPVALRSDKFSSVINLSSTFVPTVSQLSILSKGLNFCPVPKEVDLVQAHLDIAAWQRRMRLTEFFSDKEDKQSDLDPFKRKSTWNPPRRCRYTEDYLKTVETEFFKELDIGRSFHQNMSSAERTALRELTENGSITIKKADKGSGVIITDTDRYIKEGLRQLHDTSVYKPLPVDPTPEFEQSLKGLVKRALENGTITESMSDFALPRESKLARFYLLPKVHKPGVPGRPVVSSSGSLTEKVSGVVDHFLKPYLPAVTSYLKDTSDFLQKVRSFGTLPEGTLLVTLDVVGLYPSIPHKDGISALSAFLLKQGLPESTVRDICDLAYFVLSKNVFEFNSQIYQQVSGTAIGTKMAPSYAIIFMHMLESQALAASPFRPFAWLRFIDDVFAIWLHGREKLDRFIEKLNNCHNTIKFTWDASTVCQNFLDVTVSLSDSRIYTDLYTKPIDTHQYLHPASCHPGHCKRAIPFSQALRILNICSKRSTALGHLQNLTKYLTDRGHSKCKVSHEIKKAICRFDEKQGLAPRPASPAPVTSHPNEGPNTNTALSEHKKLNSPSPRRIPLVLTYHPGLPDITAITRRFLPVLHLNQVMKEKCPEPPLVAFRKPRNLSNLVIRAEIPNPAQTISKPSCGPCSLKGPKRGRKCELCLLLPVQASITSTSTGRIQRLALYEPADCDSVYVVYCITCTKCTVNNQYVGQTMSFRKRMNNHKSNIRLGKEDDRDCSLLYDHFKSSLHTVRDLRFTILERCLDQASLLKSELKWMWTLKTISPAGLNTRS